MPFLTDPRRVRSAVLCLSVLLLTACGGGGGGRDDAFEEPFPVPTQPGGGGGGSQTPPPTPSQDPIWNPVAADLGRTALFGAFSSDLVRHGDTLFAVDADAIETTGAQIRAYDVSGESPTPSTRFVTTTIRDTDLVDSAGAPGDATAPIGFGYFLNDIEIVSDTLGFALVNAGGSDSVPTLSNLLVFNPTSGALLQTLPLHLPFASTSPLIDSSGAQVPGNQFLQSGAEAMAYFPETATTGRLYVAMSNLIFGAPSYGATKYPGTVQVLAVDTAQNGVVSPIADVPPLTRTIATRMFNPVALRRVTAAPRFQGLPPVERLLVTCAGTTGYDSSFNLVPVTDSSVEAYDATTDAYEGLFNLGRAGLASIRPALGTDASGTHVGFYPSSVTGEVYLLRLDGLYTPSVEPTQLAVLRGPLNGIPITAAEAGAPGGNITGIALSPDGRTLALCGFGDLFAVPARPGRLFLLNLPEDLRTGSGFGTSFLPGSTEFAATPGRTLGNVVLVPNGGSRPDVFVNVSGTLDANFLGTGHASIGSLQTFGLIK